LRIYSNPSIQITWDAALPQLRTDPRFTQSPLPAHRQRHLFHAHVDQLRSKYLNSLYALFEAHAPSLATPFSSLPLPSLLDSLPATKLGFDVKRLEREFERRQQDRTVKAQAEFNQMLSENPFVEFWGRLGKLGGEGVDGGVKADDLGEDEGEGGGGTVDMKALAKTVDVGEMEKVLTVSRVFPNDVGFFFLIRSSQNDKRYIMFDHVPERREQWIRVGDFFFFVQRSIL
jgi:heat shock protein beta